MWQLSIRSKIIVILLVTGLACLAIGGVIGYRVGEAALRQSIDQRLTVLREVKRRRVERTSITNCGLPALSPTRPRRLMLPRHSSRPFGRCARMWQADSAARQADAAALEAWYTRIWCRAWIRSPAATRRSKA